MFKTIPLLVALCTLGLVACGPGTSADGPQAENITLQLNRMEDGDFQYCDEATGECQDLPPPVGTDECIIIEVDIDPATGATCERCITQDGEVIDLGCTNTSVGCVLVTLPEPDCVVCAYVNGAIIFSSCIAEDEPECRTDDDCVADDGMRGFCFEGQCIYEEGCLDDHDCPPGFQCVFPPYMDPETGSTAPSFHAGTCVPRDIPCLSDEECPSDMMCEVWCYEGQVDCPPNADGTTDCMPPSQCQGICVDRPYDPCDGVVCRDGEHCEVACWADGTTEPGQEPGDQAPRPCYEGDPNCGGGFGCEPVCVPDPTRCQSDDDCGENEMCEMWCYEPQPGDPTDPNMECDPAAGEECAVMPPCEGICVPYIPDPCDDIECAPEQHCEVQCILDIACPNTDPFCGCVPVCVDDPTRCLSDDDCAEGEMCELWCYELPVDCNDPDNSDCIMPPQCEGTCVPAVVYCYSNDECPQGQICQRYDDVLPPDCEPGSSDCDPNGGLWAPGICVDDNFECVTDEDCADGDVWNARCINGHCEYQEQFCMADSDCPAGFACELLDCADESGTDCGPGFPGICVPTIDPPECTNDEDCMTSSGEFGVCIDGMCVTRPNDDCFRTGCSSQICADEHVNTTCEWMPEYACYDLARCERQADGVCGWTVTDEFQMCLQDPDVTNP